jgi:hypothetical protein
MSVVVVGHTGPAVAVNKKTSSTVAEAAPRRKVTAGDRPFLELAMTKQIDQGRGMEGKRGMLLFATCKYSPMYLFVGNALSYGILASLSLLELKEKWCTSWSTFYWNCTLLWNTGKSFDFS